jgi:predicted nucleotidyltransferase component of viral defense system
MNEQALKDRLQAIAKEKGLLFNKCWKQLLLERFLCRLARSECTQQLIFKGGFLLSYMLKIGRETTALDFLLTKMSTSQAEIRDAIEKVIFAEVEDGFSFACEKIEQLQQPHMDYPGYRINLKAAFGRMQDRVWVDVGVGDIVIPTMRKIRLYQYRGKPLFENEISLLVYPPETIFAEKLETILSKGAANSRMKDYHDLLLLAREPYIIDRHMLLESINNTCAHRGTLLGFIDFSEDDLRSMNKLWQAHLSNLGNAVNELELPKNVQEAISEINIFLNGLLDIATI